MTFELKTEWWERGSQPGEEKWCGSFLGSENSRCKGPEAGIIWLRSEWEVWDDDRWMAAGLSKDL